MKPITAVVIGAGARGRVYADFAKANPDKVRIVGVAEPNEARRTRFSTDYGVSERDRYADWEMLLSGEKRADAAFICTMDTQHFAPCMQALELGYHVLLEKPMSTSPRECVEIEHAAKKQGVTLAVCHVLRYTPFYGKIKALIDAGEIGKVQVLEQTEHVGYWHYAHSYVRGNWRKAKETSPMILAKCSHDLDILTWLADAKCERISSFGSLNHFKAENAPLGAPERCLDGCPHSGTCLYYAPNQYLTDNIDWPTDTICVDMGLEAREQALRTGPYGRCVYHCDNDVVDHQVVAMEFSGGVAATLTMTAFTPHMTRTLRIMGTKGILEGDMDACSVTLHRFGEEPQTFSAQVLNANAYGHGGGDVGLMEDFALQVQGRGEGRTGAKESLRSHLMAFAAEKARVECRQVEMEDFERSLML